METKVYAIPYGSRLRVSVGDRVEAGDELTEGSVDPKELLRVKGVRGVQDYLLQEVQKVYRMQGVEINDKHIEVMIRQMLRKVRITDAGDTDLLPGSFVDIHEYRRSQPEGAAGRERARRGPAVLLGITKASLETDSFLSAASFQETTRVLTDAAIKGKVDRLLGLKENVIIGKLIPAGTGMARYRNLSQVPTAAARKRITEKRVGRLRPCRSFIDGSGARASPIRRLAFPASEPVVLIDNVFGKVLIYRRVLGKFHFGGLAVSYEKVKAREIIVDRYQANEKSDRAGEGRGSRRCAGCRPARDLTGHLSMCQEPWIRRHLCRFHEGAGQSLWNRSGRSHGGDLEAELGTLPDPMIDVGSRMPSVAGAIDVRVRFPFCPQMNRLVLWS